ncbi:MAG: hypothetical protein ACRDPJ_10495, partial [Nocardioidaceae bacterium]
VRHRLDGQRRPATDLIERRAAARTRWCDNQGVAASSLTRSTLQVPLGRAVIDLGSVILVVIAERTRISSLGREREWCTSGEAVVTGLVVLQLDKLLSGGAPAARRTGNTKGVCAQHRPVAVLL